MVGNLISSRPNLKNPDFIKCVDLKEESLAK